MWNLIYAQWLEVCSIAAGELVGSAESNLHITIEGETKLVSIHMTCDMIHFYYLTLYPVSSSHHIQYLIISRLFTHTHYACLSYPIWSVNKMCTCLHLLAYNCIRSTHINSVHVYIQTFRRSPLRWPVTNNIFYTWTTHNQPVWHTIHRFIVLPSQPVLLLLLA